MIDNHIKPPSMRRNQESTEKTVTSEEIADQMKAFKRRGGKIQKLRSDEFGQDQANLSEAIKRLML